MIGEMSAYDLAEWSAYFQMEPWGEERADLRAGIVSSTLANIHRGRDTPAYSPADFMPYQPKKRATTEEEIVRKLNNFMRRYH